MRIMIHNGDPPGDQHVVTDNDFVCCDDLGRTADKGSGSYPDLCSGSLKMERAFQYHGVSQNQLAFPVRWTEDPEKTHTDLLSCLLELVVSQERLSLFRLPMIH